MSMALALSALNNTFQQYFTGVSAVDQIIDVSLLPKKTISPGIGAYIGSHDDPVGEITALRMDTLASVRVEAGNADISSLVEGVTAAIMGVERAELQNDGIYRLKIDELEPVQENAGNRSSRVINFSLLYEYLSLPTESEFQISDVLLDMDLNAANGDSEVLINTDFSADWEDNFDVIDDPDALQGSPSNWQFDITENALHQTSNIRGGGFTLTARKSGTYLLLKPEIADPVQDFLIDVDFKSLDNDGVGYIFRYQDIDNFYYCLLSLRNNYAMFGKKINGNFNFLDDGGQANLSPYEQGNTHRLKLIALGTKFQVQIDDNVLVNGSDESIRDSGRVGPMCHANNDIFFYRLQLLKLLNA